jgi:hypothetical protein
MEEPREEPPREERASNDLPVWEHGTPGILCTHGPHAIPVSTAIRAGEHRIVLALSRRRESLALLREHPRVAFCLLGRDLAFTAHGSASVAREELDSAAHVAAIAIEVDRVQDHCDPRTQMLDGARWRHTTDEAEQSSKAIAAELAELAEAG